MSVYLFIILKRMMCKSILWHYVTEKWSRRKASIRKDPSVSSSYAYYLRQSCFFVNSFIYTFFSASSLIMKKYYFSIVRYLSLPVCMCLSAKVCFSVCQPLYFSVFMHLRLWIASLSLCLSLSLAFSAPLGTKLGGARWEDVDCSSCSVTHYYGTPSIVKKVGKI